MGFDFGMEFDEQGAPIPGPKEVIWPPPTGAAGCALLMAYAAALKRLFD